MERNRAIRKILIFALIGIVLASCFTTTISHAATLTSGKSGTSKIILYGKGKDGKYYYSPHSGNRQLKFTVRISGTDYEGYCIQIGKRFDYNGQKYTVKNYKQSKAYQALSASKQRLLALALMYGYNKGKSAPYGNVNDYRAATQTLVWETVNGEVGLSASGSWSRKSSQQYKLIRGHSYAVKNYNWMKAKITAHVKGASFAAANASSAKTYTMKYNYQAKKWSASLTDANGGNYYKQISGSAAGLSMSRSGKTYTFSTGKEGSYTAQLANEMKTGTSQGMIILQPSKSANQALALGATDETKFYVKFKTESAGTLQLVKTTDPGGSVKGFRFQISCADNGYSGNFTTDEKGLITTKLYPGTYQVTEQLTKDQIEAGYTAEAAKTVKVSSGTVTVKFHNQYQPTTGKIKILKQTDDNGPVEGIPFQMKGILFDSRTLSAQDVIKQAEPAIQDPDDTAGTWEADETELKTLNEAAKAGRTGVYKITLRAEAISKTDDGEAEGVSETQPGFSEPEVAGPKEAEKTDGEKIKSTERLQKQEFRTEVKVRLTAAKEREDKNACERTGEAKADSGILHYDFSWAGAASTCEKTAKTGQDGIFLSDQMEYGTYTITEHMTDELAARYHKPKSETVVLDRNHANGTVAFTNHAKTGDLKIKKTCIDGNVADIEMTITGTTAYGEKIEPIVRMTDETGMISVEKLPAGTYTIAESNLDKSIYLPVEPKKITITGEEKEAISVTFQNIPYSDVEISKKSATTGEELPGASLQVKEADSGKVIDQWTSTDQPHMIKNLIYGERYILHEELCPNGYVIANDVTFVAGDDQKVEMVDELTETILSKIDLTTGEELPGATLQVIKPDTREVIEQWVSTDKPHTIEGLITGQTYIMREITAPDGYEIAEEVSFIVGQQEKVEMKDRPTVTVVETGDRINRIWIAICVATLALIGILALLVFRKARNW